jgi:DNA-directed RNA polymerase specialized sigma24 family protein
MPRGSPAGSWAGDSRSVVLCVLGIAMLAAGFFYDGPNKDVVASALVLLGAGELAIGALLPRLRELEIGPGGIRTTLDAKDATLGSAFTAEVPRLEQFAKLMCGNPSLARELVEEALARTGAQPRRILRAERSPAALRTLVRLLETAPERSWMLTGRSLAPADLPDRERAVFDAMGQLAFDARAALVLRSLLSLEVADIAAVLDRPPEVVRNDIAQARSQLRPYLEAGAT